jgi:hypothetical protein
LRSAWGGETKRFRHFARAVVPPTPRCLGPECRGLSCLHFALRICSGSRPPIVWIRSIKPGSLLLRLFSLGNGNGAMLITLSGCHKANAHTHTHTRARAHTHTHAHTNSRGAEEPAPGTLYATACPILVGSSRVDLDLAVGEHLGDERRVGDEHLVHLAVDLSVSNLEPFACRRSATDGARGRGAGSAAAVRSRPCARCT